MITVNLPINRPGKDINVNGVVFEPVSYRRVMESEYVKELLDSGMGLPLICGYKNRYFKDMYIPLEDCIGRIKEWYEDHVVVEMTEDNYNLYIVARSNSNEEFKAGILAVGTSTGRTDINEFAISRVLGFDLLHGQAVKSTELE